MHDRYLIEAEDMGDGGGTVQHVFTVSHTTEQPLRPWLVECSCSNLSVDAGEDDLAVLLRVHWTVTQSGRATTQSEADHG